MPDFNHSVSTVISETEGERRGQIFFPQQEQEQYFFEQPYSFLLMVQRLNEIKQKYIRETGSESTTLVC